MKNSADVIKYLNENWSGKVGGPIKTLDILMENSGYFEVPHLLMTYIEYLSGLYSGKGSQCKYTDVQEYLSCHFPSKYKETSSWLIYLYRHGLVHQYAPKSIKTDNRKILSWYISLDSSEAKQHLTIVKHPKKLSEVYHLSICVPEFVRDFKSSIEMFCNDILNNSNRFNCFVCGYEKYA
ncbi:MAG: hypothetical protein ABW118_07720 [Candidatus Thiodiazotropha sp.]